MSLRQLLNQPISIQTIGAPTQDAYGNDKPGELGSPTETVGFIEQVTSAEDLLNRDTTKTTWQAFLPAGTVIGHLDIITFEGQTFQVDGEPWLVWHPGRQLVSHVVCKLVSIRG